MVGISGRVAGIRKSGVQVELTNSGQIIDWDTNERFFIGDPVMVSSEQGKIIGVTRSAQQPVIRSMENEKLGGYWKKK